MITLCKYIVYYCAAIFELDEFIYVNVTRSCVLLFVVENVQVGVDVNVLDDYKVGHVYVWIDKSAGNVIVSIPVTLNRSVDVIFNVYVVYVLTYVFWAEIVVIVYGFYVAVRVVEACIF